MHLDAVCFNQLSCIALQLLSGGSVDGAALLASGKSDIALNWSGKLVGAVCLLKIWLWQLLIAQKHHMHQQYRTKDKC